ncbi:MAG: helix-turn-helix transcriptional regulator, partial [Clostridia bacterium]|nr:helix-turn-helix transcriptional regulator [Clostridia bacterium]
MAFGEILSNLRKVKGLSQEQLAAELGLTRQTISKWELNQSTPDLDYLVRLSDFVGVSPDFLCQGVQFIN